MDHVERRRGGGCWGRICVGSIGMRVSMEDGFSTWEDDKESRESTKVEGVAITTSSICMGKTG